MLHPGGLTTPTNQVVSGSKTMNQIAFALHTNTDLGVVITGIQSMTKAIQMCIDVSGRDEKFVYMDLGIDKGNWSRMMSGQAHFPHEKLEALMDLCGNDIPLQWLAWRRGKGLHLLESEQQRMLRERDERIRELEMEKRVLVDAIRGKA